MPRPAGSTPLFTIEQARLSNGRTLLVVDPYGDGLVRLAVSPVNRGNGASNIQAGATLSLADLSNALGAMAIGAARPEVVVSRDVQNAVTIAGRPAEAAAQEAASASQADMHLFKAASSLRNYATPNRHHLTADAMKRLADLVSRSPH